MNPDPAPAPSLIQRFFAFLNRPIHILPVIERIDPDDGRATTPKRRSWNVHVVSAPASPRALREAKAILYMELAAAVKHQLDLSEATALIGTTEACRWGRPGTNPNGDFNAPRQRPRPLHQWARAGHILYLLLTLPLILITGILAFAKPVIAMIGVAFIGERFQRPPTIARRIARSLHLRMRSGVSLADAMAVLSDRFSPAEVALVRTATEAGTLSETLQSLATRTADNSTDRARNTMSMVATNAMVVSAVILFVQFFITPKLMDIYNQLGAEAPISISMMYLLVLLCLLATLIISSLYLLRNLLSLFPLGIVVATCALASGIQFLIVKPSDKPNEESFSIFAMISHVLAYPFRGQLERLSDDWFVYLLTVVFSVLVIMIAGLSALLYARLISLRDFPDLLRALLRLFLPLRWKHWVSNSRAELDLLQILYAGLRGGLTEHRALEVAREGRSFGLNASYGAALDDVASGRSLPDALTRNQLVTGTRGARLLAVSTISKSALPERLGQVIDDLELKATVRANRLADCLRFVSIVVMGLLVYGLLTQSYGAIDGFPKIVGK